MAGRAQCSVGSIADEGMLNVSVFFGAVTVLIGIEPPFEELELPHPPARIPQPASATTKLVRMVTRWTMKGRAACRPPNPLGA
jgi:hypothetical protein